MTIREWIYDRQRHGKHCFSVEDIRTQFPKLNKLTMRRELTILSKNKTIVSVYRGFYVIVPPHYAINLKIPAYYYIDYLMTYLAKPYYLSLLTAGVFWGAAHQRPWRTAIMTVAPRARTTVTRNDDLIWVYRPVIPEKFLKRKNTETGTVLYSNAELTAIDLIQYEQHIGGLSRAATVLSELIENTDFSDAATSGLFDFTTIPTIQRLGFILDEILGETEQANVLYEQLCAYTPKLKYQYLSRRMSKIHTNLNDRWKIYINAKIEPDDL